MKKYFLMILMGSVFTIYAESQSVWDTLKEKSGELLEKCKQITRSDSCREYSDYTCTQLEQSNYNVYVWLSPSNWGDEPFSAGSSSSLSGCRSVATNFAYRKGRDMDDYICCLITQNSSCAEKHR